MHEKLETDESADSVIRETGPFIKCNFISGLTVDIWPGGPAHRPSPAPSDQFDCSAGALFLPLAANCVADRLADETYWPPCLMLIKALSTSEMGFIASSFLFSSLQENANRLASIVTVAALPAKEKNHWSSQSHVACPRAMCTAFISLALQFFQLAPNVWRPVPEHIRSMRSAPTGSRRNQ